MTHMLHRVHCQKALTRPFLEKIQSLFLEMDEQYTNAAQEYGFVCSGCEDNCCLTRFYHHTVAEYLFLMKGVDELDTPNRAMILETAKSVCQQMEAADKKGEKVRIMCPLNQNDMCLTYEHRPMICRLHGIPHQFRRTGVAIMKGPGCKAFDDLCGHKPYRIFDRTPFYVQLAGLEKELRKALDFTDKIKMTIAHMLVTREL